MQQTLFDTDTLEIADNSPLFIDDVMRSAFLEVHKWQEFHENGQLWIDGQIGVVPEKLKHLYNLIGFKGFEGKPTVRVGVWTKYFDNGQLAWQLDYVDSMYGSKFKKRKFPSFRKDGTGILD